MPSSPIYHPENNWKIYYEAFTNGEKQWSGVYWVSYKSKGSAMRAAKRVFDDERMLVFDNDTRVNYKWVVSKTSPWEKIEPYYSSDN